MRYGFFETLFLLQKHVTLVLYSLDMGRQMAIIETKYGFGGNFNPIIKILAIIEEFTLIKANYAKEIENFIVEIFKFVKANDPWMYDLVGEFTQVIRRNKKCLAFHHKSQPHVQYFVNQIDKQVEEIPTREFGPLKTDPIA